MARLVCKCGEILSNGGVEDVELTVYTGAEWEEILSADIIEPWKIPPPKMNVWRCSKCERIYVFEDGNDKSIKSYVLEE